MKPLKMQKKDLQTLRHLIQRYYLEKRDDTACHAIFAIRTAMKAIETDCDMKEDEDEGYPEEE